MRHRRQWLALRRVGTKNQHPLYPDRTGARRDRIRERYGEITSVGNRDIEDHRHQLSRTQGADRRGLATGNGVSHIAAGGNQGKSLPRASAFWRLRVGSEAKIGAGGDQAISAINSG